MAEFSPFETVGGRAFTCAAGKAGAVAAVYVQLSGISKFTVPAYDIEVLENKIFDGTGVTKKTAGFAKMGEASIEGKRGSGDNDATVEFFESNVKAVPKTKNDYIVMMPNEDGTYKVTAFTGFVNKYDSVGLDSGNVQGFTASVTATGLSKYGTGSIDESGVPTITLD